MRALAAALLSLLCLIPNRTSNEPQTQPQEKPPPPGWSFVSPGFVELHSEDNCYSWVVLFRQAADGVWIYRIVPVPRAKCQPHPGEYPDEFYLPWT